MYPLNKRLHEQRLASITAFFNKDKTISNLIHSCYLHFTDDWRIWIDTFGNQLIAFENKDNKDNKDNKLKIIKDKRDNNNNNNIINDLYFYSDICRISSLSTFFYYFDDSFVCFVDQDKVVRIFDLGGNKILPLEIGIDKILFIIKNYSSNFSFENGREDSFYFSESKVNDINVWYGSWPSDNEMFISIKKKLKLNV